MPLAHEFLDIIRVDALTDISPDERAHVDQMAAGVRNLIREGGLDATADVLAAAAFGAYLVAGGPAEHDTAIAGRLANALMALATIQPEEPRHV